MKLNNKGYSMIELFAVIFIASIIIFPMVTTLVNNIEINDRLHDRRSATSIAQGTLEGFNRMTFTDIEALVATANSGGTYYVELDGTSCDQLSDSADIALCNQLFSSIFNNLTLTDEDFKVYIHNFNLTSTMQNSLVNNNNLPDRVKNDIAELTATVDPNPELYYIYVWIEYDNDTASDLVLGGLLSDE
jgi:type II secretory pathway pseudopilin PulG